MTLKRWWTGPPSECCETGWVCGNCDSDEWTPQEHWWAFKTNVRHRIRKAAEWVSWYLPLTPREIYVASRIYPDDKEKVLGLHRTFQAAFGDMLDNSTEDSCGSIRSYRVR